MDVRDVNGMTQLMKAAIGSPVNGIRIESQDEDDEDGTGVLIADLVAQGADLNATMDTTGETPLHLAARFVCAAF